MPIQQMVLGSGGEASDIIWSNLVLYLDAGKTNSYSGSGTTWSDLTAGNHHATLVHSPTYSSTSGGGSFTFDGTNDYATIPDDNDFIFGTGAFTEEAWFKRTSSSGYEIVLERGDSSSWGGLRMDELYPNPTHYTDSSSGITGNAYPSISTSQTSYDVTTDWVHIAIKKYNNASIRFYRNGTALTETTYIGSANQGWLPQGTSVSSDYNLHIAGADSSKRFTGEIAIIRVYNTGLSDAQITQHYNAEKARFGHS